MLARARHVATRAACAGPSIASRSGRTVDSPSEAALLKAWRAGTEPDRRFAGGLTSRYVADHVREKFVVRCGGDIPVHHVFRDRERAASRAAFEAGLSPEVVHVEPGITVLRFIAGRTFGEADMREQLARIVPLLKTCHREVGRRAARPGQHVLGVPRHPRLCPGGSNADPKYLAVADALERRQVPLPIVFGHHDLLPGNFMDDGQRLWLIDWEYGGFGTAMFDLANLSSNGEFDAAQDETLLAAYFGGRSRPSCAVPSPP